MGQVFDPIADQYDRWYDTPEGGAIFRTERDCLLSLYGGPFDSWIDVGVGTGRFAHALGIPTGVDPSPNMLAMDDEEALEQLRQHERTGHPLGDKAFVKALGNRLGRNLLPKRPGPKPNGIEEKLSMMFP